MCFNYSNQTTHFVFSCGQKPRAEILILHFFFKFILSVGYGEKVSNISNFFLFSNKLQPFKLNGVYVRLNNLVARLLERKHFSYFLRFDRFLGLIIITLVVFKD